MRYARMFAAVMFAVPLGYVFNPSPVNATGIAPPVACYDSANLTVRGGDDGSHKLNFSGQSNVDAKDLQELIDRLPNEGVRLQLQNRHGETVLDQSIPGGDYNNRSGWTGRSTGNRGSVKYRASGSAAQNGIGSVSFKWNGNQLRSRVSGRNGTYPLSSDDGPFSFTLLPGNSPRSDFEACAVAWQLNCVDAKNGATTRCDEPASIVVIDRVLRISDQEDADNIIIVAQEKDQFMIYLGGASSSVSLGTNCARSGAEGGATCSGADYVMVDAGGGNDIVFLGDWVGNTLNVPAEIYGGDGNDIIVGGEKENRIYGGAGFDELTGGPGRDELYGGEGADRLDGKGGDDRLFGGAGNDRLSGGNGDGDDADEIFGGEDLDTVTYLDHKEPVNVSFDGIANDGLNGEGDNVGNDVERLATEFLQDIDAMAPGSELLVSESVWSGSSTPFAISTVASTQVVAFYEVMQEAFTTLDDEEVSAKCLITVAARELGDKDWTRVQLDWREQEPLWDTAETNKWPSCIAESEWTVLYDTELEALDQVAGVGAFLQHGPEDGHNRIVLAFDEQGHVHLAANMHAEPMRYWRSNYPVRGDSSQVSRMERHPVIHRDSVSNPLEDHPASGWPDPHFVADPSCPSIGYPQCNDNPDIARPTPWEQSVTYPTFQKSAGGDLIMTYRLGSAGQGDQWAARFDPLTKTWSRMSDGPYLGFVNRKNETPSKNTSSPYTATHFWGGSAHLLASYREKQVEQFERREYKNLNMAKVLTYVRTRDWASFRNAAGDDLQLPVTQETEAAMIEASLEGGIHFPNLGQDSTGNPTAGYPIYDYDPMNQDPEAEDLEPMFCRDEVRDSKQGRVLKARVAIFRGGEWHKVDLACSRWVWGRDNDYDQGLNRHDIFSFWVSAPEERILDNGQRVFVAAVTFSSPPAQEINRVRKWFVIDYATLTVSSDSVNGFDSDPGGKAQVKNHLQQPANRKCDFRSLGPLKESGEDNAAGVRRDLYRKSVGEADAGDYYRLRREVLWSTSYLDIDQQAKPSDLYVLRTDCDKGEPSWSIP